jgi:branched-chain amino acid transport system permease protein
MEFVLEVILLGSFYSIMAIGLNFIFGITNIVNFAHGEILMIGAFVAYFFSTLFGISFFLAAPISMVVTFILGVILYRCVFARIANAHMPCLIASLGLSFFLATLFRVLFASSYRIANLSYKSIEIFGLVIDRTRLNIAVFAIGSILLTHLFLKRTLLGKKIRAVTQSSTGALLVGIDIDMIMMLSFAIGLSLTGLGGALAGLLYPIHPYMGALPTTLCFLVVILGGLGNFFGTLVGAFVFAAIQQATLALIGPSYTYAVAFIFLAFVLIIRPEGILGRRFGL